MLFNSLEFFLIFLPIVWAGFFLIARVGRSLALAWLALASLLFYSWWDPAYLPLLVGSILFNFVIGYALARRPSVLILAVGIATDLGLLFYFKYAAFAAVNLSAFLGIGLDFDKVVLPLGISFFTFTQIAFLVDAYRGEAKEYRPVGYFLFASFFPHLIAGPILHHKEMMPQFAEPRTFSPDVERIAQGLTLFAMGLFKKVALADSIAAYATPIFDAASLAPPTFFEAWSAALSYTFQIYFDFSGYTDMALGAALMFGIVLPLNFASPYKATSIISFWRQWHMTLSRFLRDYLYVPLGGSRRGRARHYTNLAIVMVLGGLWHGAGWTFLAWGALHGTALLINHAWRASGRSLPKVAAWAATFVTVVVGWVFFRAAGVDAALAMLKGMAGFNGVTLGMNHAAYLGPLAPLVGQVGIAFVPETMFSLWSVLWIGFGLIWCSLLPNSQEIVLAAKSHPRWRPTVAWGLASALVTTFSLATLGGPSEFLYFNF